MFYKKGNLKERSKEKNITIDVKKINKTKVKSANLEVFLLLLFHGQTTTEWQNLSYCSFSNITFSIGST